ncbi:maltose acetyltransferase domain-containing protein [Zooshikella ganghwensis]|uniref:maltose acetyltransferase domain-containing protein n=1 Tax=Zooshikella ganghwensis TaxID=202772 RepID=UPI0004076ADC|nr:maltose acetyltransferase domain-containing protein [Zooshikella ganghwensis]
MTEKEKMLAGLPYNSWDDVLLGERMFAKSICQRFNQFDPTRLDERMSLLSSLLLIKDSAHIEPNFFVTMAIISS